MITRNFNWFLDILNKKLIVFLKNINTPITPQPKIGYIVFLYLLLLLFESDFISISVSMMGLL
jgi:hypothetical protein